MRYYAAHTTGRQNRETLRNLEWGMLGSAAYRWRDEEWGPLDQGGLGWALDNGAWGAFTAGRPFDNDAFRRAVVEAGRLDFVVVPDVVMDADGTRAMRDQWLDWTLANADAARVLLPVQNGMEDDDLPLSDRIGVFVGGDDRWKERTMHHWRARTDAIGAYLHVGRVNSVRRLESCWLVGADSVDGSGASRWSKHAMRLGMAFAGMRRQGRMFA